MAQKPTRGLGRGLSALMSDLGPDLDDAAEDLARDPRDADRLVAVEKLHPNPDQPRRRFAEEQVEELAASIRAKGVIQPLIVRPDPAHEDEWQIVAGERRWRAAQRAGVAEVPVVVRDYGDAEVLEIAIIENVQRADLDPIEEGAAYQSLMERFGHTQEQVAKALGKSRSHVANQMRLLQLPVDVQAMLVEGQLTAGHARPLIGHPDAATLAQRIRDKRLSVREAEKIAKAPAAPASRATPSRAPKDDDTRELEGELSELLKMPVRIDAARSGEDGGRITITFRSMEQLDDLLARLTGL